MLYFSYNDFMDYTENGEVEEVLRIEEKIARYEIQNGEITVENDIVKILKNKNELRKFLKEFLDLHKICNLQNINYCNQLKTRYDKEKSNNIICKVADKEIFVFIKVIEKIDSNISYKIFENSSKIIERWNKDEKKGDKRYPIVIPIVIYIGQDEWKTQYSQIHNDISYIEFQKNRINFSYNMLNINDLKIENLENKESLVAKVIIELKKKYLQIN